MLSIGAGGIRRLGGPLTRRELLRVGAIGLGGLTLPGLLRLQQAAAAPADGRVRATAGRARSVILLFLSGGPAHQDMWDLKPDAPEEIRGTFRPIATNVAGIDDQRAHAPHGAAGRQVRDRPLGPPSAEQPSGRRLLDDDRQPDRTAVERGRRHEPRRPAPPRLGPGAGPGPDGRTVPPFVMLPEAMQPNGPERAGPARRIPRGGVRPLPDQQRPEPPRLFARRPRAPARAHRRSASATAARCSRCCRRRRGSATAANRPRISTSSTAAPST